MSIYLPLETPRLILRDFVESDLQEIQSYASDAKVVRYLPFGPNKEEDTKNYLQREIALQRQKHREHFALAIVLKSEKQLIGSCRISVTNSDKQEGSIGYCLARKFWKKGYATEATRTLLEFGFKQLNLHRIFATCHPENTASTRVLVKIGMRQEGYLRESEWIKGEWRDSLLYAIVVRELMQMQIRSIEFENSSVFIS
jgi:[ribosomal protein S5]-alanine N-acetyltransferase